MDGATAAASGTWLWSASDLRYHTPSRRDGIGYGVELWLRKDVVDFTAVLGERCGCGRLVVATAAVFLARFWSRHSFKAFEDRYVVAEAALFLAAKAEEERRPILYVVQRAQMQRHAHGEAAAAKVLESPERLEAHKEKVLDAEMLLLKTLDYALGVTHPYLFVLEFLGPWVEAPREPLGTASKVRDFQQLAAGDKVHQGYIGLSLRTTLCLQFPPGEVAAGCMLAAGAEMGIVDPALANRVWEHCSPQLPAPGRAYVAKTVADALRQVAGLTEAKAREIDRRESKSLAFAAEEARLENLKRTKLARQQQQQQQQPCNGSPGLGWPTSPGFSAEAPQPEEGEIEEGEC